MTVGQCGFQWDGFTIEPLEDGDHRIELDGACRPEIHGVLALPVMMGGEGGAFFGVGDADDGRPFFTPGCTGSMIVSRTGAAQTGWAAAQTMSKNSLPIPCIQGRAWSPEEGPKAMEKRSSVDWSPRLDWK